MKFVYVIALLANAALLETIISSTWGAIKQFGWHIIMLWNLLEIVPLSLAIFVIFHALVKLKMFRTSKVSAQ